MHARCGLAPHAASALAMNAVQEEEYIMCVGVGVGVGVMCDVCFTMH